MRVLSKGELDILLASVKEDILDKYSEEISQIILFGSYAKDKAKDDSDIDILIVFNDKLPTTSDQCFGYDIYNKYLNINKEIHLVFEKEEFYKIGCEEYYRDVPTYGKIIWNKT